MGKTHHDARPLTEEEAKQLYDHIRAVEALNDEIKDIQSDKNERITLCCEVLPINKDVFDFVIKRRKAGRGTCGNFDSMLELVEEAVLAVEEQRRDPGPPPRKEREVVEREEAAEAELDDDAPPFEPDEPDSIEPEAERREEPVDPF